MCAVVQTDQQPKGRVLHRPSTCYRPTIGNIHELSLSITPVLIAKASIYYRSQTIQLLPGNPGHSCTNMASAAAAAPQCWVLHYHECVPDVWARIKEQPPEYEQEHLGIARGMLESGKLVAAGAMGDPVDAGLWIFKGVTKVRSWQICCCNGLSNDARATCCMCCVEQGSWPAASHAFSACPVDSWRRNKQPAAAASSNTCHNPVAPVVALICSPAGLLSACPLSQPHPCACVSQEEVESSVVSKDPYVRDGLIKAWTIKPLHVVIGSLDNSQSTTTQSPAGLAATAEASDAEAAPAAAVEARAML